MPGLHVTDTQVRLYMSKRTQHTQATAAAMAGISERTARQIDKDPRLPSQSKEKRSWRTREDPLIAVWPRALEMLNGPAGLMAVSIFETLQEEFGPDAMPDSARRTLERRVADWRALHGPDKEVFFPQRHDPGRQGLSDFTVADELGVSLAGEAFPHRLYHFRLAYSGWEHVHVILGGESFSAVAEGLQDALWKLQGVPAEHRTDSLSAAFKNLDRDAQLDFTRRYDELSRHYGMTATRNNPGVAHENGSIESPNGHLKRRLDQALLQRVTRDFDDLDDYRRFVALICDRHNARRRALVATEREKLGELPKRRTTDFATVTAPVTRNSTISVDRVLYTVPPRLIGRKLEVHLFDDRLECFLGPNAVVTLPRRRTDRAHRGHAIDYRHVIGTLKKKPQALRHLIYRDELFPRAAYARTWQALDAGLPARQACRVMVGLLDLAATGACEAALADRLDVILDTGQLPDLAALKDAFAPKIPQIVDVTIPAPDLAAYNPLLRAEACR
jgi:transposase InsO family protein